MPYFTKKPVTVEAIQYLPDHQNCKEVAEFLDPGYDWDANDAAACDNESDPRWPIDTLEGVMWASPGDWIIKGVQGEFYPCKPDIFAATYEPAAP